MIALLITHTGDNDSAGAVARAVAARGGEPFRLDTDLFPTELRLTARYGGGAPRLGLAQGGRRLDLSEVGAVWHRRLAIGGAIPLTMDSQLRRASILESRASLLGAIAALKAFHLDWRPRIDRARDKAFQLELAGEVGLAAPRTLVTNDPGAARSFARECEGGVVAKMLSSFSIKDDGGEKVVFTTPVSEGDLEDLDGLRYAPMTFQERVPKELELRATVAGRRVFTASIDSQSMQRAREDWRREGGALERRWRPYALPAPVERRIMGLMDRLGLNYGALDLIVTPGGEHVFLEVNPVGEFWWLERWSGLPISEAIADVLLGRAGRREGGPA